MVFPTMNEFDNLYRDTTEALSILPRALEAYNGTLQGYEHCRIKWKAAVEQHNVLSSQLSAANNEIAELLIQTRNAHKLSDEERKKRILAEKDRDYFESQLENLRGILKDKRNKLSEDAEYKRSHLEKKCLRKEVYYEKPDEFQTTGSVMADLSYTRDEEGVSDALIPEAIVHKHARSGNAKKEKRKRSSATRACELQLNNEQKCLITTTTVTVDQESNIHATSVVESKSKTENQAPPDLSSISEESDFQHPSTSKTNDHQTDLNLARAGQHNFLQKAMLKGEACDVCSKRLEFSSWGFKCLDCKTICHINCQEGHMLPCVLNRSTPLKKSGVTIADYTPSYPPMIPSLVLHCIKEVEERGLKTVGLYLITGSDIEAKALKEKFIKGKFVPNLSQIEDIHIICSCLKHFLSSMKDPLTTKARRDDLASAVQIEDSKERRRNLCHIIAGLPQPNRDTLAYLILHLQVVNESPECKMPNSNLANAFGPILIGYSDPENVYEETNVINKIMNELLELPKNYWGSFISEPSSSDESYFPKRNKLQKRMRFFDSP